ncbi:DUF4259 domain-containing protein [Kitasatospora sp. NPDC004615]|uniref:DUF4259 domain-containing protein n=1 Tax=Kitasatospora sp. NPDC004615 TaxID=3364017 RepID=UPI0036B2ECDD
MGAWDIGLFDNDTAADFAGDLDEAAPEQREALIRAVLGGGVGEFDDLDADDGCQIVAAAALVAAQCPGGTPISTAYGPDQPLPLFGPDVRRLALNALAGVLSEESELAELWDESDEGPAWRHELEQLRTVLAAALSAG